MKNRRIMEIESHLSHAYKRVLSADSRYRRDFINAIKSRTHWGEYFSTGYIDVPEYDYSKIPEGYYTRIESPARGES